jgi:hypothetical protein
MTYFHPERTPVLPAPRREAARRQLEQVVERSGPARLPRRVKPAAITAGAVAIVLTTGAFAYAAYESVTDRTQARCYTEASLASNRYVAIAEASDSLSKADVRNAVDVCAALYRQGILRLGHRVDYSVHSRVSYAVPPLTACTLPAGVAAVFPGSSGTCAKLGLPAAAGQ